MMEIKTRLDLKREHLTNNTFEDKWVRVDELIERLEEIEDWSNEISMRSDLHLLLNELQGDKNG